MGFDDSQNQAFAFHIHLSFDCHNQNASTERWKQCHYSDFALQESVTSPPGFSLRFLKVFRLCRNEHKQLSPKVFPDFCRVIFTLIHVFVILNSSIDDTVTANDS